MLVVAAAPAVFASDSGVRYACGKDLAFTVRFTGDSAVIDAQLLSPGEPIQTSRETLSRDAGPAAARHTAWSNASLGAEFGLGAGGREALLHFKGHPIMQMKLHCVAE